MLGQDSASKNIYRFVIVIWFCLFVICFSEFIYTFLQTMNECLPMCQHEKCINYWVFYTDSDSEQIRKGRMEISYLMTHSTHFIYSYMSSDIW